VRTIPALLVTIGIAASLTGCAASGAGTAASDCATPGAASRAVTASGAFGKEPKVSVPAGLTTTGTQVSVLRSGEGRQVEEGTPVVLDYTLVDGATGKAVQSSGYTGPSDPITAGAEKYGPIGKAVECARVGDRLAVAIPKSAFTQTGTAGTESRRSEDAVVAVIDVERAFDSRATGTPQLAGDGMPAVVLAPSGQPGITIPSWSAPADDQQHLLRKGSGAELTERDTAVVKFTAVSWPQGGGSSTVLSSSWSDGSGALTLPLAKGQVVDGVRDAIVDHHVGDQVLAVVHQQSGPAVYVIDIVGRIAG